jgi:hypothetical protein
MFEVELLELINRAKKTQDNYELNNIKNSISKLISENEEKFNTFINQNTIDESTKNFLIECQNLSKKDEEEQDSQSNDDFVILKNYYKKWLNFYNQNNNQVEENCSKIIDEIINFYILNRFDVLERILDITDTQDYEAFKWHIKNKLRIYFAEKIEEYMDGNYKKLSFLKKLRKKKQLNEILKEISEYKFDKKFIEEVLE